MLDELGRDFDIAVLKNFKLPLTRSAILVFNLNRVGTRRKRESSWYISNNFSVDVNVSAFHVGEDGYVSFSFFCCSWLVTVSFTSGKNFCNTVSRSEELRAKPMPCNGRPSLERNCFWVVIPTTSPAEFRSGPPLFPGLIAVSV